MLIIHVARELILVADHTRFGRVTARVAAPITVIDEAVTDKRVWQETIRQLRDLVQSHTTFEKQN